MAINFTSLAARHGLARAELVAIIIAVPASGVKYETRTNEHLDKNNKDKTNETKRKEQKQNKMQKKEKIITCFRGCDFNSRRENGGGWRGLVKSTHTIITEKWGGRSSIARVERYAGLSSAQAAVHNNSASLCWPSLSVIACVAAPSGNAIFIAGSFSVPGRGRLGGKRIRSCSRVACLRR